MSHGRTSPVIVTELRPFVENPWVDTAYLEPPLHGMVHEVVEHVLRELAGRERMGAIHRHGAAIQSVATALQRYRDALLQSVYPAPDEPRTPS